MEKERLDLYEALAKTRVYKKRFGRGKWAVGDRAIVKDGKVGTVVSFESYSDKINITLYIECRNDLYGAENQIWLPPRL